MGGHYSETDAMAAIYLVGFSTLSSGSTNWGTMLEVCYDWLTQTGIHEEQNPKLTLMNMTAAGRYAAKATIVSNNSRHSPPNSTASLTVPR